MNKKNILLLLFLPILMLAGCTKEDYRNCPAGLYVTFEPQNPKHNYAELVQGLDLYFYGQDGNLAANFHYDRDELRPYDRAAFVPQIPAGKYRLVAVVNDGADTETSGIEKYETLKFGLKKETVDSKITEFFTAQKQITVGLPGTEIPTEKMELYKHNNHVRLKIVYDGYDAPADMTLQAYMQGHNRTFGYLFEGYSLEGLAIYLPWTTRYNTEGLPEEFDMATMHIRLGGDLTVHLEETSETGATGRSIVLNLADELKKVKNSAGQYLYDTDEKLWYYDEYEITVTIGKDFVVIGLTIDNWTIIGGGVEV